MFAKIGSKMLYKTKLSRKIFTKKKNIYIQYCSYTTLVSQYIYFFFQLHGNSRGKLTSDWRHYTGNRIVCNPHCGFPQLSENKFKHSHVIWKSWWQRLLLYSCTLTLLLRHTTGHMDMPRVQQQQMQPQSNQRILTGIVLLRTLLTRVTVALNSSGAT